MIPVRPMRAYVGKVYVGQQAAARNALIAQAYVEEQRVKREQAARAGGIAPTLTRIVDGKRGATYESVKENGQIILQWHYLREIAKVVMERLRARSPVVSGDYKKGIQLFAAGTVDRRLAALPDDKLSEQTRGFVVVATVPYARMLEVGRNEKGGPFVVQVKPHIVEETAQLLRKDYAGVATVKFTYSEVEGPARYQLRNRVTDKKRERKERSEIVRYPSIQVDDPR